ncbi:MAG: superoxide dismutase family protein [Acidimicrobiia bacterium]|nr:superoxide dismutase family protein [Acidimicrobiia bacterium]
MLIATALVLTAVIASPVDAGHRRSTPIRGAGEWIDVRLDIEDPTDGARYVVRGRTGSGKTKIRLQVAGIEGQRGRTFGVHVHVGPCVEGDGAAAGPHFNITGGDVVSPETEIWLGVEIDRRGRGRSRSRVEFEINADIAKSIVIHEQPTAPDGAAGARLACLPLQFG